MDTSSSEATEIQASALFRALEEAKGIAETFTAAHAGDPLAPDVNAVLDTGSDDRPLFVFSMYVDLEDDLDPDEYPLDPIEQLSFDLRSRIVASAVVDWAWLVTVGTKASAAHL